jgi:hypothetical protein
VLRWVSLNAAALPPPLKTWWGEGRKHSR